MKTFTVVVVTLVLVLLELLAGNRLLAMFFPLYGALYFAVAYRKSAGIWSAAAAGMILDVIYHRPLLLSFFLLPVIVLAALTFVKRFRRHQPWAALSSGAVCGAGNALVSYLMCQIFGSAFPGPDLASVIIFQSFSGALFMLIFSSLADVAAFKCNLPRFSSAGKVSRRFHHE